MITNERKIETWSTWAKEELEWDPLKARKARKVVVVKTAKESGGQVRAARCRNSFSRRNDNVFT
jgi:hypothetical protein